MVMISMTMIMMIDTPFLNNSMLKLNIARGTTDPEIDSVTWIKLGNNMALLTLVANLANIWRHLH